MCHASEDESIVRQLARRLRDDGFAPWLAEEEIVPGQSWQHEIAEAIHTAGAVLICLSGNSTSKEGFLQKEIRAALEAADEKPAGRIFIIPARLEDCPVPYNLRGRQWVNLFEGDGYERLIAALRARVQEIQQGAGNPVQIRRAKGAESPAPEAPTNFPAAKAPPDAAGLAPGEVAAVLDHRSTPVPEAERSKGAQGVEKARPNPGDHPVVVAIVVLAALVAVITFVTGKDSVSKLFGGELQAPTAALAVAQRAQSATAAGRGQWASGAADVRSLEAREQPPGDHISMWPALV
jgi:hypothetical protein